MCYVRSPPTSLCRRLQPFSLILQPQSSCSTAPIDSRGKISSWSSESDFRFTNQKTLRVVFLQKFSRPTLIPPLFLQNFQINLQSCAKFLGITFDYLKTQDCGAKQNLAPAPGIKLLLAGFSHQNKGMYLKAKSKEEDHVSCLGL